MTLVVDSLVKSFGSVRALDGVSFAVEPGEVFGFLGANGAGKTTTMRVCLDVLRPDSGSVTWNGIPNTQLPRRTWGYLTEERGLYGKMRVLDQLVFFARLRGVPADDARRTVLEWLDRFRIPDYRDRKAEELSKGNQQKVRYVATILHDPDVLLMDEPFVGLDPVNVAMLKTAFTDMRDRGKTLVFSTHQLEQAEELCDAVTIIDHGRVVAAGSTREVRRSTGRQAVRLATSSPDGLAWLDSLPHVTVTREGNDYSELRVDAGTDPQAVLREALARGQEILHFEVADPSLEDVFVERVGAANGTVARDSETAPVGAGSAA